MKRFLRGTLSVMVFAIFALTGSPAYAQEAAVALQEAAVTSQETAAAQETDRTPASGYLFKERTYAANGQSGKRIRALTASQSGTCGSNISWTLQDGVLTVSGSGAMEGFADNCGVSWSSIKDTITKLVIGNGITSIGTESFVQCGSLTAVELPATLTTIGSGAFYGCTALTAVVLPDSVTTLERGAFAGCQALAAFSGKNVAVIGEYAFERTAVTVFEVPQKVTELEPLAFFGASIREFTLAAGNSSFAVQDGVLFNKEKTKLVIYPSAKEDTSYQIPSGCKTIGAYAFHGTANLQSVGLNGVTTLDDGAFYEASIAGSLTLPDSITTLNGSFTFESCQNLTSVTFGNGFKETAYRMFEDCTGLTSIDFGNTLMVLGMRTFLGCDSLTEVTLPDRMTEWGGSVFNSCRNLTTFRSNGLKTVQYADFAQCYNLQNVTLGSVEKIYRQAFARCSSLTAITLPKTTVFVDENAFAGTVSIRCENSGLVRFGNNGLHYAENISITGTRDYEKAFDVLKIVNQERSKQGLNTLYMDSELLDAAMVRAQEQAVLFSHTRPDGSSCFSINEKIIAENVAIGSKTAKRVMEQWMNSSGHRENILETEANTIGIGCYYINGGYTWVQVFSDQSIAASCAQPKNRSTTASIQIPRDTFDEAANTAGIIMGSVDEYTYELCIRSDDDLTAVGEGKTAKATLCLINPGFPSFVIPLVQNDIRWTSEKGTVAAVDSTGRITGKSAGRTVIKAATKYHSAKMPVRVIGEASGNTKLKEIQYTGTKQKKKVIKIPSKMTVKGVTYQVTSIAPNAFKNNKTVTTIVIPSTVKKIGKNAFYNCKKLKSITIKTTKLTSKTVGAKAFAKLPKKAVIKVPKTKLKAYKKLLKQKGAKTVVIK